jgi:peptide/nickel transport system permease protein
MFVFLRRRILGLIPVLWGVITIVFLIIHLVPGDPAKMMLGDTALPSDVEALRESLGLNKPLINQYVGFFAGLFRGNLGKSFNTGQPVLKALIERFPNTLILAIASLFVAVVIGILGGIITAAKSNTIIDSTGLMFSLIGVSMPAFLLGPILILVFSVKLGIFPVSGSGSLKHLVLPSLSLGFALSAIVLRMTRASMLEVLSKDYIRTARAIGISEKKILIKHALRNAIIPVVTIIGLQFGALLGGVIIVEIIFSWPGIGQLLIPAIMRRDYPLVQGCILFISVVYIFVNFIVDIIYAYIDPRIRYS